MSDTNSAPYCDCFSGFSGVDCSCTLQLSFEIFSFYSTSISCTTYLTSGLLATQTTCENQLGEVCSNQGMCVVVGNNSNVLDCLCNYDFGGTFCEHGRCCCFYFFISFFYLILFLTFEHFLALCLD